MKSILTGRVILLKKRILLKAHVGFVLMCGVSARAEEFSLVGFEKVVIVAPQAQVHLQSSSSSSLKIQNQTNLSWSVKEDGKTLHLIASYHPGSQRSGSPKVDVSVSPVAVDIHLVEGAVTAQKWTRPLMVDIQKGKVSLKEMKGLSLVNLGQGQVQVFDQEARLQVDLYKGDLTVKNARAPVEVSGLQGQWRLEKVSAPLRLDLNQGSAEVSDSTGGFTFNVNKANLSTQKYSGRIEGSTDEGNLSFQVLPETDIQVQSVAGRVTLQSKASGARLALTSESGEIFGTKALRPGKDRGAQVLRGKLKGTGGGRVEVRSERGNILIKE